MTKRDPSLQRRTRLAFIALLLAFALSTGALRLWGQSWARAAYRPVLRDQVAAHLQAGRYHEAERALLSALDASPRYAAWMLDFTADTLCVLPELAARLADTETQTDKADAPLVQARIRYAMADFPGIARAPLPAEASPALAAFHGLAVQRLNWWDDPRAAAAPVADGPPELARESVEMTRALDDSASEGPQSVAEATAAGRRAMMSGDRAAALTWFADAIAHSDAARDAAQAVLHLLDRAATDGV